MSQHNENSHEQSKRTHVLPVIHYANDDQAMRNAERAFDAGCTGVFLIHMDHENHLLAPVAGAIKARWPGKLVGINYLTMDPAQAVSENIANGFDMTWIDAQLTQGDLRPWTRAQAVRKVMDSSPGHLVFAGVAFKYQPDERNPDLAARTACEFGFIPTTSGPGTGVAAENGKVSSLRSALGAAAPLAIASGITLENVHEFAPKLSHILVASGVSSSFYEFDFEKLYRLRVACDQM